MNISKYSYQYRNDLLLKRYADSTIENYVSQIKTFLAHFQDQFTHPEKINETAIKQYLLSAACINSQKHRMSAIKLFYRYTIKQPMKLRYIEYPRSEKKLPQPLDQTEIQKLFTVCKNPKHRAIIALLYGCGLRVSEVINMKITDIDSKRMIINILAAKGRKDRIVMLDQGLLQLLRQYYKIYRPQTWLFNGQHGLQYTASSINQFLKHYAALANINKNIHAHLFRHSFATHALESGTDISLIQKLLGHSSVKTTQIYTHVSTALISNIKSPLAQINY